MYFLLKRFLRSRKPVLIGAVEAWFWPGNWIASIERTGACGSMSEFSEREA